MGEKGEKTVGRRRVLEVFAQHHYEECGCQIACHERGAAFVRIQFVANTGREPVQSLGQGKLGGAQNGEIREHGCDGLVARNYTLQCAANQLRVARDVGSGPCSNGIAYFGHDAPHGAIARGRANDMSVTTREQQYVADAKLQRAVTSYLEHALSAGHNMKLRTAARLMRIDPGASEPTEILQIWFDAQERRQAA